MLMDIEQALRLLALIDETPGFPGVFHLKRKLLDFLNDAVPIPSRGTEPEDAAPQVIER